MELQEIFSKLWNDYAEQNPSAHKIHRLFSQKGEQVVNDHIAFRTFNDPRVNIEVLSQVFVKEGYVEKGSYTFEKKHLKAKHYELEGVENAPRVFISQLILEDFSDELQQKIHSLLDSVDESVYRSEDLVYSGRVWGKPSHEVYKRLREESEYAAWLYVFGFRANHFTVSVNALEQFDHLAEVNEFLKDKGFALNTSGGEIKGTPDQLLMQSSTLADRVPVEFEEGTREIPGCYYEFAARFRDPEGKLFSGFIAQSADKIFESTNFYKK